MIATSLEIQMENLKRSMQMRGEADRRLSPWWASIPLIYLAIAAGAAGFWLLTGETISTQLSEEVTVFPAILAGILVLAGIVGAILLFILLYRLIKRRNEHFRRHRLLEEDVIAVLNSLAKKKRAKIGDKLVLVERNVREAGLEEKEESAFLWAILSFFIPFVGLYVGYFLMRGFYRHERREDLFLGDLEKAAAPIVAFERPRRARPIPDRNIVLYIILTILTAGVFGVYWLYTLIVDPNNHFDHQAKWEDKLFASLSKVAGV